MVDRLSPAVCPIRVNGVQVRVTVYPTSDRADLPLCHQRRADTTTDGAWLYVADLVNSSQCPVVFQSRADYSA